ncbi:orotidine-5'-phosphate decarboxylase [Arthrobacter castelli]|uniref:orotidine-5'-phosphate decarboxylase n=1 Tax=Arthrobacter castelli TaxID=271431 RepID=UPI00041FA50F|nr:orotidine-5'-phosphate decarboxylase [Arthrobacter castelli]
MTPVPVPSAPFGHRLHRAVADKGQLCVGIDPHPRLLADWGLEDTPAGLETFSQRVVESVAGCAAIVKPQVALYERHGSAGLAVLEETLTAAAEAGVLTLADAKRGDIGSTMAAYADAWLRDGSSLAADAVTLSPFLGFGSLRPALDTARESGRGVFVLALTSNPEGASVQHRGEPYSVAHRIVKDAAAENEGLDRGSVGVVIGAATGEALRRLSINPDRFNGPILAPGLGAQGATPADLAATFGAGYGRVLASASRSVLAAGPGGQQLREAAERLRDELRAQR